MARNDGIDRTVARNRDLKKSDTIKGAQAHNERQKEIYSNPDIVPERTPFNVHFKEPTGSYEDMFKELEQQKVISIWGQKPDSTKFCELIFDVNSAYRSNNGGYEFAKRFYADAYEAAVKIVGGEQFILSAVMHADERNRAMSEALGEDIYHYHLHVVYIPVVEKQILWSKRCKDPALIGTVKETVMQVSRSKKWDSKPAVDDYGEPLLTPSGKKILKKSYSVLQDDFYEHMIGAGYTDLQRGERGSTEEHLTVTQFKVEQEKKRLEAYKETQLETLAAIDQLGTEEIQKQEELAKLEKQTEKAQDRLDSVVPVVQDAVKFAREHISYFDELVPEPGPLESAKSFREKKIMPLINKLKDKFLGLYRQIIDLKEQMEKLQRRLSRAERDRDHFKDQLEKEKEKSADLLEDARDLMLVKRALGPEKVDAVIAVERERDSARAAEQAELERQRKLARKRSERDDR